MHLVDVSRLSVEFNHKNALKQHLRRYDGVKFAVTVNVCSVSIAAELQGDWLIHLNYSQFCCPLLCMTTFRRTVKSIL